MLLHGVHANCEPLLPCKAKATSPGTDGQPVLSHAHVSQVCFRQQIFEGRVAVLQQCSVPWSGPVFSAGSSRQTGCTVVASRFLRHLMFVFGFPTANVLPGFACPQRHGLCWFSGAAEAPMTCPAAGIAPAARRLRGSEQLPHWRQSRHKSVLAHAHDLGDASVL